MNANAAALLAFVFVLGIFCFGVWVGQQQRPGHE